MNNLHQPLNASTSHEAESHTGLLYLQYNVLKLKPLGEDVYWLVYGGTNSVQFSIIYIAHLTLGIITKQLYRIQDVHLNV